MGRPRSTCRISASGFSNGKTAVSPFLEPPQPASISASSRPTLRRISAYIVNVSITSAHPSPRRRGSGVMSSSNPCDRLDFSLSSSSASSSPHAEAGWVRGSKQEA